MCSNFATPPEAYISIYWGYIGIMEKKMETTIMENQMEKKMENEMEYIYN